LAPIMTKHWSWGTYIIQNIIVQGDPKKTSEDSIFSEQSVFTVFCTEDKRQGYFTQINTYSTEMIK
jgi:hypothetical protein